MKKTRNVIPCLSAWKLWEAHAAQLLPGLSDERPPAGVDEAGRGCLAGPVVAAAVILPESAELPGLTDSKALSAAQRAALAPRIRQCATAWGLGVVWPRRIDEINILQATFEAMTRAVCLLSVTPGMIYVDGNKTIPEDVQARLLARLAGGDSLAEEELDRCTLSLIRKPLFRQHAYVKGDGLVPAISAASVLAKTWRDALMTRMDERFPGYGLAEHKGYGTRAHLEALQRLGPTPLHRRSFRGVTGTETD